jgi:uncharacterized membrane protein YfcA
VALLLIACAAALVLLLTVSIPALAQILRFNLPPPQVILASLAIGLIGGGWYGVLTRLRMQPRTLQPT